MAEESKLIIFPKVRISDLKRDRAVKKERLALSSRAVNLTVQEHIHPLTYIRKNPKKILGILTSAATALTVINKLRGGKSKKLDKGESKKSLAKNLLVWGGGMAVKMLAPSLVGLVKYGLSQALRSNRD